MKNVVTLTVVVAAVAATTTVGLLHSRHGDGASVLESAVQTNSSRASTLKPSNAGAVAPSKESVAKKSNPRDYADALHKSENYLVFARSTISAASAGDPNAQFNLGKALNFCDETYRAYFRRAGRQLSVQEAVHYAAELNRPTALIQSIFDRCHDLVNEPPGEFGSSMGWIAKAATAGEPGAQSILALMTMSQNGLNAVSNGSAHVPILLEASDMDQDPHSLLIAAVESKDPETLWNVGRVQGYLAQDNDSKILNGLAWWLVSCQRGFDCGPGADWIQLDCVAAVLCPTGVTGVEYIQTLAADSWDKVQERALEINAKLDANGWSELGLGG